MIKITEERQVIYLAGKIQCLRFPEPGDERSKAGLSRNFQIFEPMKFLVDVTQHIADKASIWYANLVFIRTSSRRQPQSGNGRAHNENKPVRISNSGASWAALIKEVCEVNPLQCPQCEETMKIISFIEKRQLEVIEKILCHCGLWQEVVSRPPQEFAVLEPSYDYRFFDLICI